MVFGDTKTTIYWVNNKHSIQVIQLIPWMDKIRSIICLMPGISFSHVYREYNQEADTLSKEALGIQEGFVRHQHIQNHICLNQGRIKL